MSGTTDSLGSTSRSLLERVRENDRAAWDQLVSLYAPFVYRCCSRAKLPPEDVADVFQEVFQAAVGKIGSFQKLEAGATFRGWLVTITRNKVNDHFRRQQREPRGVGGTELQIRMAGIQSPQTPGELDVTDEAAELWLLRDALDRIRPHFKSNTWNAFRLTVVEGRSTADVAEELSMTPGAVRVAKSRVLQRLRTDLGDLY